MASKGWEVHWVEPRETCETRPSGTESCYMAFDDPARAQAFFDAKADVAVNLLYHSVELRNGAQAVSTWTPAPKPTPKPP